MFIPGLILLNLYICLASPFLLGSDANIQQQFIGQNAPALSTLLERWLLKPRTSHLNQDLWSTQGQSSGNFEEPEDINRANRSDLSINSIESNGNNLAQDSSFNKNTKVEDDDRIETHVNNHQSYGGQSQQNSRQYNSYQAGHYSKYLPQLYATGNNNHNLNLNYIQNMLTKPLNSGSLSSLLGSSGNNNLAAGSSSSSSSYGLSMQNAYYSSMSSLSQLSNSYHLPQSQAQRQQSAQSIGDQLQNLTSNAIDLPSSPSCGRLQSGRQQVSTREPRIVGGNSTYEGEFPWAVSIQRHGNHHCGGVIVGRRWILTAAHCVRSQQASSLIVRTGGHTLSRSSNSINSHLERDYFVDQIVMHDDFSRYDNLTASQMKSSANTNNADIALLRLKQDIQWNELALPVCFPHRDSGNFSGHDAVVIGWGKLNEKSEEFSNELQKVKLTIIDNRVCQNWFRQAGRDMPIDDRIICAGFKNGGKDACHGDSGGPLLSKINGHYVVVGVVSTGIGCARPLLPGLYSRVSSYIGWIERYVAA